jgi:hypothetical protein
LVVVALVAAATARADDTPLRLVRDLSGDKSEISVTADTATNWNENGIVGMSLAGHVSITAGTLHIDAARAVVWSQPRYTGTNAQRHQFYIEDGSIKDGAEKKQSCKSGLIDVTTGGNLGWHSKTSSMQNLAAPPRGDPLYQRAFAARQAAIRLAGPSTPEDGSIQTASVLLPDSGSDTGGAALGAPGVSTQLAGPTPPTSLPPGPEILPTPTPLPGPPPGPSSFRYFTVGPRYGTMPQAMVAPQPDGRDAIVITGGVIVTVYGVERFGTLDLEADRVVVWTRGGAAQQVMQGMQGRGGDMHELEFYLAGHVEMRQQLFKRISGQPLPVLEQRIVRASEMYYDVDRNVALSFNVEAEVFDPNLLQPLVFQAEEIDQVSPTLFHIFNSTISASRLSSDPGFSIQVAEATLEDRKKIQRGLLGTIINRETGRPQEVEELWLRSRDVLLYADHVPFFYLPYLAGDARDPLGPIEDVHLGYSALFGFQVGVTLNAYDLIGISPLAGTRWKLNFDYLSKRGPVVGTEFNLDNNTFFGIPAEQHAELSGTYVHDTGADDKGLGGPRPGDPANLDHPTNRGFVLFKDNVFGMPHGFSLQGQFAFLSDKNYLEEFDKREFDTGYNKETFLYLKQQQENWAWTVLAEPKLARPWVTETEWLPRAGAHWLGQSFDTPLLDLFTFSLNADAGYAQLRPATVPPFPVLRTDVATDTARFDVMGEVAMPLPLDRIGLGDLRVVPYADLDLTYYTTDLTGASDGRVLGGGGVRTSLPLSRLYPDVSSDLFYLNGIYHKIVFSANYYAAQSTDPYTRFPQLDRLFYDTEDMALRDVRPFEATFNPIYGPTLASSAVYDPQRYAIRQLVLNSIDTRDSVEVVQGDIRQRWQTKRGYPGMEHTVDWMTLDLSASFFPRPDRDNFGNNFAFLQYDWVWNIGDRTSLVSTGWLDPETDGPSMFTVGAFLNRPDRTNFFVGYREIDKLRSKAITGAVTYVFNPKYAMTMSTVYDFGTSTSLTNSLVLTRVGKDLQLSFGVSYNAILNNFGVVFEIVPNIASKQKSRYLGGMDPRLVLQ